MIRLAWLQPTLILAVGFSSSRWPAAFSRSTSPTDSGARPSRTPRLGSGARRTSETRPPTGCELLTYWGRFIRR
jgi:hypothetical protein